MSQNSASILENAVPPSISLGQRTARGFVWFFAQMIGSKALAMLSQVVLAWLLRPEDFGLIGLAWTLTAFASVFQAAGLKDVLVQRQAHFDRWANPAFWMSLAMGLLTGMLIFASAPAAVALYGDPRLFGIVLVMAATAVVSAVSVVPMAFLQGALRFRTAAILAFADGCGVAVLSVALACLGFGAYSFVLPRLITTFILGGLLWWIAPVPIRWSLQVKRWRLMIGDTSLLVFSQVALIAIAQGDRVVLGMLHPTAVVGIYYFAFSLSTQAVQLLSANLTNVLFPSLAQLQGDVRRQTAAYLRVTRLLATASTPLCLLQAAVAGPVVRLLFASVYEPAIPVIQVLSIAMAFIVIAGPSYSMIKAQGRFKCFVLFTWSFAAALLLSVLVGALLGQALAVAIAATVCYGVFMPLSVYLGARPGGAAWLQILRLYAKPLALSTLSMGLGYAASQFLPAGPTADAIRIGVVAAVGCAVYAGVAWRFSAEDWLEISASLKGVLGGRKRQ